MNARIYLDDIEVTDLCLLSETRINGDISRRLTTANITFMAGAADIIDARYDFAFYDQSNYSLNIRPMRRVRIEDAENGAMLFAGQIVAIGYQHTDAEVGKEVKYACELNDDAFWLDRAVAWGGITIPMPTTDDVIIKTVVTQFCPQVTAGARVKQMVTLTDYEWQGKTCRQIIDDMMALSVGEWGVDFESAELFYGPAADLPAAPFELSTSPDHVTSFPVRIDSWKSDFTNPVNHAYVRGAIDTATGLPFAGSFLDNESYEEFGDLAYSLADQEINNDADAVLRAQGMTLRYSQPTMEGSFTIIGPDGLKWGQRITITDPQLGIRGTFVIRSLTMQWLSKDEGTDPTLEQVQYTANFGARLPDLETYLRLLGQQNRWNATRAETGLTATFETRDGRTVEVRRGRIISIA